MLCVTHMGICGLTFLTDITFSVADWHAFLRGRKVFLVSRSMQACRESRCHSHGGRWRDTGLGDDTVMSLHLSNVFAVEPRAIWKFMGVAVIQENICGGIDSANPIFPVLEPAHAWVHLITGSISGGGALCHPLIVLCHWAAVCLDSSLGPYVPCLISHLYLPVRVFSLFSTFHLLCSFTKSLPCRSLCSGNQRVCRSAQRYLGFDT